MVGQGATQPSSLPQLSEPLSRDSFLEDSRMAAEGDRSLPCPDWEMLEGLGSQDRRCGTWEPLTCSPRRQEDIQQDLLQGTAVGEWSNSGLPET